MASGAAISHRQQQHFASASGGHSSFVSNGGRSKRKSFSGTSGPHPIAGRQKFWSRASTSEVADHSSAVAAASKGAGVRPLSRSQKERITEEGDSIGDDASMADAARLLQEFRCCPRPPRSLELVFNESQECSRSLAKWGARKRRSAKGRRCLEESPAVDALQAIITICDDNPPPDLQSPLSQVLDRSILSLVTSSPGRSLLVATTSVEERDDVKVESGLVRKALEVEEVEVHTESDGLPSDVDRLHKLVSDSSTECPLPDSRAESPGSPASILPLTADFRSIFEGPKFEGCHTGKSAFQKFFPVRPIKKPMVYRKLKVEEKTFEAVNSEPAEVKHLSRKKPRPTAVGQQQQQQQQLVSVKTEKDVSYTEELRSLLLPAEMVEKVECQQDEATGVVNDPAVLLEERIVKMDQVVVKVESKLSGRIGHRGGGKPKLALSESEKEARKQRRVQANRESARQTIRRKQVLCEELSKKSQHLSAENDAMRKKLEQVQQDRDRLRDYNAHLVEQVKKKAAINSEPGPASPAPPILEQESVGVDEYQFALPQFGGLPFGSPQSPLMWAMCAFAAQSGQTAGIPVSELNMGDVEYTSPMAATAAFESDLSAAYWRMLSSSGSSHDLSTTIPFFPHRPVSVVGNTTLTAHPPPLTRSISLPTAAPDSSSFSLAISERALTSDKKLASYGSGDFAASPHLSSGSKRSVGKRELTRQGSGFSRRGAQCVNMMPESQSGVELTSAISLPALTSNDGDSGASLMNTLDLHFGRSHSLAAPPSAVAPSILRQHSRHPLFGSGSLSMAHDQSQQNLRETEAQKNAAAAAEARRRRREVTRSKYLQQHRQPLRLAEPSAS